MNPHFDKGKDAGAFYPYYITQIETDGGVSKAFEVRGPSINPTRFPDSLKASAFATERRETFYKNFKR